MRSFCEVLCGDGNTMSHTDYLVESTCLGLLCAWSLLVWQRRTAVATNGYTSQHIDESSYCITILQWLTSRSVVQKNLCGRSVNAVQNNPTAFLAFFLLHNGSASKVALSILNTFSNSSSDKYFSKTDQF